MTSSQLAAGPLLQLVEPLYHSRLNPRFSGSPKKALEGVTGQLKSGFPFQGFRHFPAPLGLQAYYWHWHDPV